MNKGSYPKNKRKTCQIIGSPRFWSEQFGAYDTDSALPTENKTRVFIRERTGQLNHIQYRKPIRTSIAAQNTSWKLKGAPIFLELIRKRFHVIIISFLGQHQLIIITHQQTDHTFITRFPEQSKGYSYSCTNKSIILHKCHV